MKDVGSWPWSIRIRTLSARGQDSSLTLYKYLVFDLLVGQPLIFTLRPLVEPSYRLKRWQVSNTVQSLIDDSRN